MALSFDAAGDGQGVGNNEMDWSHTCGASANKLLVAIGFDNSEGDTISSITYNGDALSFVAVSDQGLPRVEIWQLNNPDTGAAFNVHVVLSGVTHAAGSSASFIDAAASLGSASTATGTSANPSVTVADSASGDIVFSALCNDNSTGATTQAGTLVYELEDLGSNLDVNLQRQTASGSNTVCSWTNSGSGSGWAAIGVAVKPTGGGPVTVGLSGSSATFGQETPARGISVPL